MMDEAWAGEGPVRMNGPSATRPGPTLTVMELSHGGRSTTPERDDAAEALTALVGLALPRSEWAYTVTVLETMGTALRTDDSDALRGATGQLDLIGPSRIRTRLGEETEPPPPDVLERVNRLVHALRSEREPDDLPEDGPVPGGRPH